MERLIISVICLYLFVQTTAQADIITTTPSAANSYNPNISTLVTPQNVQFSTCTKEYSLSPEKLYFLTIASINANRFEILELQTKTGYILFKAVNKEFLAAIFKLSADKSLLKITPTNNNYYFAPGIVLNIFKYIDLNLNENIIPLNKI